MCGIDDSDQGPTWSWRWASSPNLQPLLLPRRSHTPCNNSSGPSESLLFDPFTFAYQSGFHLCCYVSVCTTDISATAENKHSPTTMGCNYLPCTVRYVFIIVCQELDDGMCYWSRLTGSAHLCTIVSGHLQTAAAVLQDGRCLVKNEKVGRVLS